MHHLHSTLNQPFPGYTQFKTASHSSLNDHISPSGNYIDERKSISSGSSVSTKRRKLKTLKQHQRKSTLTSERLSRNLEFSSDDSDQDFQRYNRVSPKLQSNARNIKLNKASSNSRRSSTPFSNTSTRRSDLVANNTSYLESPSTTMPGPNEAQWNNLDEMMKRINSNLSTQKDITYNSSIVTQKTCDATKSQKNSNDQFQYNSSQHTANDVCSNKDNENKDVDIVTPGFKGQATMQPNLYNPKHTTMDASDASEKELELRMSDEDDDAST